MLPTPLSPTSPALQPIALPSGLPDDLPADLRAQIAAHAQDDYPRESCGLIVATSGTLTYRRCRNVAAVPEQDFVLAPQDWAAAEDSGDVLAVVHSHPNASAHATMADRVMCERMQLPWLVMGWPSGVMTRTEPTGWRAPLIGRQFHHGVLDCYTLVQDYYAWELGIALPDVAREDGWWEAAENNPNHYRANFERAGFVPVSGPPRLHDGLLMRVASRTDNHGAVYLGDGTLMHHLHGRLSTREVWGGMWEAHTTLVLRHRELLGAQEHAQVAA